MSYLPLSPPHSNRILSCLCSSKAKKVLFYLALKIVIFGLIFHRSGDHKKPQKFVNVDQQRSIFTKINNESCLLPNPALFMSQWQDLPHCEHSADDWLWITVNGDVLPKEGREDAYCKKRRSSNDDWEKLLFGEKIHGIIEVKCTDGRDKWRNYLWKFEGKEAIQKRIKSARDSIIVFHFNSIGKAEFKNRFPRTVRQLMNDRTFMEIQHFHGSSDDYFTEALYANKKSIKNDYASLIIDQPGGSGNHNLSLYAHHYGSFNYPEEMSCMHNDVQHEKSFTILSDFLQFYQDSSRFASVHISITKSSDLAKIDGQLSRLLKNDGQYLKNARVFLTTAGSSAFSSATSYKEMIEARLPFLALSLPSGAKIPSKTSALVPSHELGALIFSEDIASFPGWKEEKGCKEAGISDRYCMCAEKRDALRSGDDVEKVVEITSTLLEWLNEQTLKYRYACEVLNLDEIVSATKVAVNSEALRLPITGKSQQYFIEPALTEYSVRFRTSPGGKEFDATVVVDAASRVVEINKHSMKLTSSENDQTCLREHLIVNEFCACKEQNWKKFYRYITG